jgi:anti-sigma B factor antagonist/stage II sporulation protein AA (anti-sigma F factor antagonist)
MRLADLQLTSADDAVIARLTGEIDMSNARELRAAITDATPNHALGVVLDLSDVTYIDSAGIHMLYRLGESLRNRGQTLRVVIPPSSPASAALRLAGLNRNTDMVEAVDEGLRAIAAGAAGEP